MDKLNRKGKELYFNCLKALIGKNVIVEIDRLAGFNHNGIIYELNYGFVNGFTAPDGELQDAYVIDSKEPAIRITGKVIGIVHRRNDNEDKLLVATIEKEYTNDELQALVNFQERFFDTEIWR